MKKIINGRVYDTETAKCVAAWTNGGTWKDFNHVEENLYRKKTGEFFLFGEGGPRTQYAERVDNNMWGAGSRIMPVSYAEAKTWAEEHLDGDDFEAIFGAVTEDESRMLITYSMSAAAVETIKRRAAELGISAGGYIESLLK